MTWGQNDTAHTIVVTWKTLNENVGDEVLYDTTSREGDSGLYEYSATGSHHTYSGAGGYIHDVELTGLLSDKVYYFICGGENGGWSDERSFRTAPEDPTNIRFVAGGDSRSGTGDWPRWRDNISRTMAKFNPSFVFFTGDFIRYFDGQTEWDSWFTTAQMYWVDNDNLTIPMIPCIGNHEVYYPQPPDYDPETEATNYYGQFYLPGNERWYSLDWGQDLHIVVLDSEIRSRSDAWDEQLSWLISDLALHESCKWKIVIFHRPAFSSGSHASDYYVQSDLVPLFDTYHVDLAISGHDHGYMRTYPINYSISQENYQPSPENGTVYIVSAGWGAPLYSGTSDWWTAYGHEAKYNFVVVDIFENGTLHLQAVGTDGETFDEYFIHKEVPAPEGEVPIAAIAISIAVIACAGVALYLLKIR